MSDRPDAFTDRQLCHDLAGHLNTMKLLAELLLRTRATDEDAVESLDDIIEAANAAVRLLGEPAGGGDTAADEA